MKNWLLILIAAFTVLSCSKKDDSTPAPSACFLVDATESTDVTHNFVFTNCTGPYNTYNWDFGDGQTSTDMNPLHRFNHVGVFNVKMTATNSSGKSDINTRKITLGHNTLYKIIISKVNNHINFPKHVYLTYYNAALGMNYYLDRYVTSSSQIPFTVDLSDNALYDNNTSSYYLFKEDNLGGQSYISGNFTVSDLALTNGSIDETFYYTGDSSKISLYYKIVPR
ncbi:MAG: PKD domain-containing protein [Bacteroidia bacterium]|nr:PKD domain-containing protein [Bacteroidia bacterium]